jgi:predicted O-methyltransferase YrrM
MNELFIKYGRLCATPSDIYLHLPRLVQLVTETKARHVIELGSRTGVSTIAWLYGLSRTGGHLTTVDLDEAPDIGVWPEWCHIQGDDLDPDIVSALDPADIVFIDTSHAYRQTVAELNTYRWLVKPGGMIVCHDTELAYPEDRAADDPPYPVKAAVDEFCEANGYEWVNYPECFGLGVLKVG